MLYSSWSNEGQHFFIRIYVFLFFQNKLKLLWFVRQTDGVGRQDRLPYWPITSSLDHSTLCYLQDPLSTSASRPGLLNRRPGIGYRPQRERSQWLQAGFDSAPPDSNSLNWRQQPSVGRSHWLQTGSHSGLHCLQLTAAGICIYYFLTPTYFQLDHMIVFHLFTQVHLWLMAWSRVIM